MTMTMQQFHQITSFFTTITENHGRLPSLARLIGEGANLTTIERAGLLDNLEAELRMLASGYEPSAHNGGTFAMRVAAAKAATDVLDRVEPEVEMPECAQVVIAGITLTAPADLVRLAGWDVSSSGTARDRSVADIASRRLARAISERGVLPLDARSTIALFARVIELGEIESAESRREQSRERVAKLEQHAANDRARAAYLECKALGKE